MSGSWLGRPRLRLGFSMRGLGGCFRRSRLSLALGGRLDVRRRRRFSLGLYCSFLRRVGCLLPLAETAAELQRNLVFKRAGVGFLIRDSELRQQLEEDVRLYFELASQLIYANFTHTGRPGANFFAPGF